MLSRENDTGTYDLVLLANGVLVSIIFDFRLSTLDVFGLSPFGGEPEIHKL